MSDSSPASITASVPLPRGFQAAGLHCGIKANPTAFDLALFASDELCVAAGLFTQNRVCGAPVKISRARVENGNWARGVVINSGNANACTGEQGLDDARWMTAEVATQLKSAAEEILVCSTGVIGRHLPRAPLADGIHRIVPQLKPTAEGFLDAARAMMTTDTVPKQATRAAEIGGMAIRVSGCAKGAAMIAPNMATMLAVIMTDAPLPISMADHMLRRATARSFNCISVEGHTSTSDSVILLANGAARLPKSDPNATELPMSATTAQEIQQLIDEVAAELAAAIIQDAEGATHIIKIDVRGLRTQEEAHRIAKTVADSPLVKTAIHGADPNWGRIVSACGYAGVELREEDISLKINGLPLFRKGTPLPFDARQVSESIRNHRETHIELNFSLGQEALRYWTSDLTAEYVRLNADYTT